MNTIKFVCEDRSQKEFASAVRKNVNAYFKEKGISVKGNIFLVIQTLAMFGLYITPFILILTVSMNAWVALFLVVVMGIGMAGVGMGIMHDAIHGAYSSKEWVNKSLGQFTMYLLGSSVLTWKIQHNVLHHSYTNINGYDHDIDSKGPIRMSDHAPLKPIHRFQWIHAFFFYGLMTFSKLVRDFTQLLEYTKAGLARKQDNLPGEYIKMAFAKSVYLFILIGLTLFVTPFTWWQVLIGFCVMHWTGGFILSTIFQMAHVVEGAEQPVPEDGIIRQDWAVHELLTTSDFARNNLFLNWYVGGLNFQIEHHLFPNICHIHYRKIAPIVEKTALEFGLTYNLKPTFYHAFLSHVRRLKELGMPAVSAIPI